MKVKEQFLEVGPLLVGLICFCYSASYSRVAGHDRPTASAIAASRLAGGGYRCVCSYICGFIRLVRLMPSPAGVNWVCSV